MKLKFRWISVLERATPVCEADAVNAQGFCPIADLLTDNGGASIADEAEWIADGVAKIDRVLSGQLASDEWLRDIMVAEIKHDLVAINAYDGDLLYHQTLSTNDFRRVLKAWHDFILRGPAEMGDAEQEIA